MKKNDKKILLVGTVSNVSRTIERDVSIVIAQIRKIGVVSVHLIESDSNDGTVNKLADLSQKFPGFTFQNLGNLKQEYPDRIARIRHCRNQYVQHIRQNMLIESWDYVIIADLDGMNRKIRGRSIQKSINKMKTWDALFANQLFGYYDIFALRCEGWVSEDVLKLAKTLQSDIDVRNPLMRYLATQSLRQKVIYRKMRIILPFRPTIKVDSAFGGFGIYKTELFQNADYSLEEFEEPDGSEHITFHRKLVNKDKKLGIEPGLVNSWFNEYNINRFVGIRILRDIKRSVNKNRKQRDS
jgi:hypothetical protein